MYDRFSQNYDHFVNWKNRLTSEMPFLIKQIGSSIHASPADIRVLDAAAGTGMHAIALAQQGFTVSGVDISEGMIQTARKNAQESDETIRFEIAAFGGIYKAFFSQESRTGDSDRTTLPLFNVVLCLGNSLPHVGGKAELLDAVKDFAACLSPHGLLILQNRNFDAILKTRDRWMEPQSYSDSQNELLFLRFYDFLPEGHIQFNILTLKRERNSNWEQSIMETRLFPVTHNILAEALEEAGFQQIDEFGALSNVPFVEEESGNLVVTALKK